MQGRCERNDEDPGYTAIPVTVFDGGVLFFFTLVVTIDYPSAITTTLKVTELSSFCLFLRLLLVGSAFILDIDFFFFKVFIYIYYIYFIYRIKRG